MLKCRRDKCILSVSSHGNFQKKYEGRSKMDDTFQTTFSNVFSLMRIADFFKNIIEICSQGSNQQYSNIGSDNDLAPVRRQAIF